VQYHPEPTTIAILGADTVVGSALSALLEGSGYRTTPIGSHPTGVVDELLDGADLLLLAPRLDEGAREAVLGAMGKSSPQRAEVPVIALTTTLEEGLPEKEGVIRVPWPCETKVLVERIEAALSGDGSENPVAI
jgi:CheY-like chemotaxis protein